MVCVYKFVKSFNRNENSIDQQRRFRRGHHNPRDLAHLRMLLNRAGFGDDMVMDPLMNMT